MKNYFEELNKINVSDKIEKKNGLSYLSWAWAWGELKKKYPLSYYTVYENNEGWNYFTDGRTGWVKTGVTVFADDGELEHIEYLPIMDYKNKSIPLENITSFDVNKTIQRSLTKAVARHGLGLYVYAGEDLPECGIETKEDAEKFVLTFGKYKGKTLGELIEDTGYIDWLLNNTEDENILKAIELMTGQVKQSDEEIENRLPLVARLQELIDLTDTDRNKLYQSYKVLSDTEMTEKQLKNAIEILEKRLENG